VREVIELTLGGQGYEVTSVGGGQAALAQLARETFDLIVCDLGMPEVDGIALYGALQRRPAPRPVVLFLSGFHDNARYETFLQETGVPRLVKPFEVTVLRGTVRRLLGRA
jgi:CheY-like chemotaxis protein